MYKDGYLLYTDYTENYWRNHRKIEPTLIINYDSIFCQDRRVCIGDSKIAIQQGHGGSAYLLDNGKILENNIDFIAGTSEYWQYESLQDWQDYHYPMPYNVWVNGLHRNECKVV